MPLITKHDLDEAIAECQGQRNPNSTTCLKLAAFYTIRRELFGEEKEVEQPMYSYASEPIETISGLNSDSEFLEAVEGRNVNDVLTIVDELMDAIKILQPRMYDSVMRKVMNL